MEGETPSRVDPATAPEKTLIEIVEEKRNIYFYHAYGRSMKRYNLCLSKKKQEDIVRAIKEHDPYLPTKLLKDWEIRQLWKVIYMGIKMKLIYDKKYDCIVTFLPPESWPDLE